MCQSQNSNIGQSICAEEEFPLLNDWILANDIALRENVQLTSLSIFVLYLDFNLSINYEVKFSALFILGDNFCASIELLLHHMILNFIKEQILLFTSMLIIIVHFFLTCFKEFNLFQKFNLEYLIRVMVVLSILSDFLKETFTGVKKYIFMNTCKSTIVCAFNGRSSFTVKNQTYFSKIISLT